VHDVEHRQPAMGAGPQHPRGRSGSSRDQIRFGLRGTETGMGDVVARRGLSRRILSGWMLRGGHSPARVFSIW
jgi:hypothetical protein